MGHTASHLSGAETGNAVITAVQAPEARRPGPLSGQRLVVKDLIDVAGVRTTYGSKIYADHVPLRSASTVDRLLWAGAVLVGKANLDEFAWGVVGQNQWYGTVHNPLHPGSSTGGSSSGNAAALAAGWCDLGLATDTGCSIRLPSACCGTVGLKPSWGRIAMDGIFPLCPTLDTVGPMARSVEAVALMWSVLTAEPVPEPRLAGLTAGLLTRPPSVGDGHLPDESLMAEQWAADLERLGARIVEASVPEPAADTWPLFFHEAGRSHGDTFPARADEYGDNCRAKLELTRTVDPDAVARAYEAVARWRRHQSEVDLFVAPCFTIDLPADDVDELEVRIPFSQWLRWVNLIGWAALAIGNLQFIAPRDETVLAAGLAWERDRPRSSGLER